MSDVAHLSVKLSPQNQQTHPGGRMLSALASQQLGHFNRASTQERPGEQHWEGPLGSSIQSPYKCWYFVLRN